MPLEPIAGEAGLWVNPACPAGGPAVHALIIGVSRYDHLEDGEAPAPATYGLKQLSVSALTAYRFFRWLHDGYALDGWPVGRVRLLMSPLRKGVGKATADELQGCDAVTCAHALEATFDNCKRAIESWYADMEALKAPAIGRSLFLFSGHGMERRQNDQLLLPSNYLRPPNRPMSEAISTPNLTDALSYLPQVSCHVLLLDGCRNDIDKLRGATGAKILNDEQNAPINPKFERAALSATASGLRAYSPKSGGLSLFGQALLDGLRNDPDPSLDEVPIELIHKGHVSSVEVNKLASYMKRRVDALIRAAKESVVQVVRSDVSSSDPSKPIELAELPSGLDLMVEEVELEGYDDDDDAEDPGTPDPDAWFHERYRPEQLASTVASTPSMWERIHAITGSEAVTDPWLSTLQVIGLSTHASADYRAVDILASAQAERSQLHRLKLHFQLNTDDPIGHLLVIRNKIGRRFCCVLPSDPVARVFQLEIDVESQDYLNFAAYLSPQNPGPAGQIASAWEQLRARDSLAAMHRLDEGDASVMLTAGFSAGVEVMKEKKVSPLAAAVATVLLLKGNQFERMHDWARNLANWFPNLPDGVVLWTEQRRRLVSREPLEPDLLPWFVREMSRRSLPFTANGFGLAAALVSDIVRGRLKSDDATRVAAGTVANRLDAAAPYFRDTGLFCSFSGFEAGWDAALMLGPPKGTAAAADTANDPSGNG